MEGIGWTTLIWMMLSTRTWTAEGRKETTANPRIRTHDVKDYCENENFRAACGSDEVIVMSTALYGRMEFGRCIDRDYGYVGCESDVLIQADRQCSGLRTCEFKIPFESFTNVATCPKDLKPYFKAGYNCLKVDTFGSVRCRSPDGIRLTGSRGYIASIVTQETDSGSADCPWVIEAEEGQRINLTLHDFGTSDTRPDTCHAYAIVRESARSPPRSETICNSEQRLRHVYLSNTHMVDVRVLRSRASHGDRQFLIEYNVVGCPDIKTTGGMQVKRRGNEATVKCSGSDAVWKLRCDGHTWVGNVGNCSAGISVAVIVIIALIIGTVFMIIGLLCLRFKRKAAEAQIQHYKEEQYYSGYAGGQIPKNYTKRELPWPPPPSESETAYAEENEYSYIAELPPPPASAGGIPMGPAHYPEPPKYFEFDPNGEQVRVAANGERYVISGMVDGRGVMPNGALTRKDFEKRQNRQVKNYNRSNSAVGQTDPYSSCRGPERLGTDVGQNHVSI